MVSHFPPLYRTLHDIALSFQGTFQQSCHEYQYHGHHIGRFPIYWRQVSDAPAFHMHFYIGICHIFCKATEELIFNKESSVDVSCGFVFLPSIDHGLP